MGPGEEAAVFGHRPGTMSGNSVLDAARVKTALFWATVAEMVLLGEVVALMLFGGVDLEEVRRPLALLLGAAILELKGGKVWRDARYYAEPFEAPEWRAKWVERMKARR
jgi:hypothetical protein